jgi:threonine/homoserine/homoserine lactone efflux protein
MTLELITALIAFAFVSSITPGPNNLMLMASGINFGFTRTFPHMMGVALGFTLMIGLIGIGLKEVFDTYPITYSLLKIISILFLSYLAWKIATAAPLDKNSSKKNVKPLSFVQAAAFQWINPKAWIMAVSAIGTYTPSEQTIYSILIVAGIFGIVNLPSISAWVCMGTQLQRVLNNPLRLRIFNISAALLLVGSLYPVIFGASF